MPSSPVTVRLFRQLLKCSRKFEKDPLAKALIYRHPHLPQRSPISELPEPDVWFYNTALEIFLQKGCYHRPDSKICLRRLISHLARYQFAGLETWYDSSLPKPVFPPGPHDILSAGFFALRTLRKRWSVAEQQEIPELVKKRDKPPVDPPLQLSLTEDIAPGVFLIQHPITVDSVFNRAVIFIYEYDKQKGASGIIINKPLNKKFEDSIRIHARPPKGSLDIDANILLDIFAKCEVFKGGPIKKLQLIHRCPSAGGLEIKAPAGDNSAYICADLRKLLELFMNGEACVSDIQIFVGLSGWGPGQLEAELEHGEWFLAKGPPGLAFGAKPSLWKNMMDSLGQPFSDYACLPDHINMAVVESAEWSR